MFLDNFFRTCGEYPPDVNYLTYARDLRLYSPTNRAFRENLPALMEGFYEITGTTPEGLAARLGHLSEPLRMTRCADKNGGATDYHGTVAAFKKDLLERVLRAHAGNRTYAARALGLQRTYLMRLINDFGITVPAPTRTPRTGDSG